MNCKVTCVVFLTITTTLILAGPVIDEQKLPSLNSVHTNEVVLEENLMKKLKTKCYNGDFSPCFLFMAVSYFNDIIKKPQTDLGNIEITQTSSNSITVSDAETSRSFKDLQKLSDEAQLSQIVADKMYNFIRTRSMKWHVSDDADLVISGASDQNGGLNLGISLRPIDGSIEEGRKKKDQGNMSGLIAAAMMKIGILKALAFKALVLLVGKALIVSKLALVLAAIIGLKKLFSGGGKHVTYEVVAQPHHEHHDHHISSGGGHDGGYGGGGWGRNFNTKDAQNLAYSAQIPEH